MSRRQFPLIFSILIIAVAVSGCSMMAKMMGKGDLMGAMQNMDKVMKDMPPSERMAYMQHIQSETLAEGKTLFKDRIMTCLESNEDVHFGNLVTHFRRHTQPFWRDA